MATIGAGIFGFYTKQNEMVGGPLPLDLTSGGAVAIVDDGPGQILPVHAVCIDVIDIDSLTDTAVISVGTNNPDYDNILKDHAVRPEQGLSEIIRFDFAPILVQATDIYCNVKVPADATTLTAVVAIGLRSYTL